MFVGSVPQRKKKPNPKAVSLETSSLTMLGKRIR